jgi:hypothetical protein
MANGDSTPQYPVVRCRPPDVALVVRAGVTATILDDRRYGGIRNLDAPTRHARRSHRLAGYRRTAVPPAAIHPYRTAWHPKHLPG